MIIDLSKYGRLKNGADSLILFYKGMQVIVTSHSDFGGHYVIIKGLDFEVGVDATRDKARDLMNEIENALVYEKSANPEMFL